MPHQCFHIPEILELIFDQVSPGATLGATLNRSREAQLFALAQTCRNFHQPALRHLYEKIDLTPIIKCVGRDVWDAETGEDGPTILRFSRPLSPPDAAIIKRYASMVRKFAQSYRFIAAPTVWETLLHTFKDTILFENIRVLCLDTIDLAHVALFSTQTLTSVFISHPSHILPDFSARTPNLTSFEFDVPFLKIEEEPVGALSNWQNLSRYVTRLATHRVVDALAQNSSSLRVLEVGLLKTEGWTEAVMGTDNLTFPALEELKVGFRHTFEAINFVNHLSTRGPLRAFTVTLRDPPESREQGWLQLLRTLGKYSHSLKKFHLGDACPDTSGIGILPGASILAALTANFRLLTYIKLSNKGGIDVVDEDLRQLAEAYPLLEEFHLNSSRPSPSPPEVKHNTTIASLVFFARNCRLLSSLSLGFDAREDSLLPHQWLSLSSRGVKLRHLNVQASPTDNPALIAIILFTIFPNIETICSHFFEREIGRNLIDEDWTYFKLWSKVYQLLKIDKEGRLGRLPSTTRKVLDQR